MSKREVAVDIVKALFYIGIRLIAKHKRKKDQKKDVDEGYGLG